MNNFPILSGVTWDLKKRPTRNTSKMLTAGGSEFRTGFRINPITEFDLSYTYMNPTDKATMEGFFNQMQGALTPFYFDAQNDDQITTPFGFATANGTAGPYPLYKPAGSGAIEPIGGQTGTFGTVTAPGVTVLFDNGVAIPTLNYTLSDSGKGGIVTFLIGRFPTSGHTLTWTGTYYYLVRFDDDVIEFNQFANQMYELQECKLTVCR